MPAPLGYYSDSDFDAWEDADGNRILATTETEQENDITTHEVYGPQPKCPECKDDHNVFCEECGEQFLACACAEEDANNFFCMCCQRDFTWIYNDSEIADLEMQWWDDDDNIVEAVIVEDVETDDKLACHCTPAKTYMCAVCGVTRDSSEDAWRPFNEGDPLLKIDSISDEKAECTCQPEAQYYCAKCMVRRSTPQHEWSWLEDHQRKTLNEAQKKNAAAVKNKTVTAPKVCTCIPKPTHWCNKCQVNNHKPPTTTAFGGTWYSKCRHYAETLTFPNGVSIDASSMNNTRGETDPAPDFGLYLDWGWKPQWRAEFIHWPDYGIPTNRPHAVDALIEAYERAEDGAVVEVGCIGGHGRTGTALACMGVLAGLTADESIKHVRKAYCTETLETAQQEWFVEWFEAYVNGDPLPKDMPAKTYTSTYTTPSTASTPKGGPHGMEAHYIKWLKNKHAKNCGDVKCKYWKGDVVRFVKGDIPKSSLTTATSVPAKKPDTKYVSIGEYKVPKPGRNETQHNPQAKKGCSCDFCRYTVRHGAFLEKVAGPESINVAQIDGTVQAVNVVPDFAPQPPTAEASKLGMRMNEYVWTEEGWVWEKLVRKDEPSVSDELKDALFVLNGTDTDDPTIKPDIDIASNRPENALTDQQVKLLRLGLSRLNWGTDTPERVTMIEIRETLWCEHSDVYSWDEVMGAATLIQNDYPARPDINRTEQEPEQHITIEMLKLVSVGMRRLLGTSASTIEIRAALRDFSDDEWRVLMEAAHLTEPVAGQYSAYCIHCECLGDHITGLHDAYVNDGDEGTHIEIDESVVRKGVYCRFCDSRVFDHTAATCENDAPDDPRSQAKMREYQKGDNWCMVCNKWSDHMTKEHDTELLEQEADDEERVKWSKKFHQIVKGGVRRGQLGVGS